eukprot:m.216673 g.216673  ORF g.216673 m.216673 type:complete len:275 (+) comp13809_c0_seq1:885-1709(+)
MTDTTAVTSFEDEEAKEVKTRGLVTAATSVHGTEFWRDWVNAGGDMEGYVKENMPAYALVGALLVSFSYGYLIEIPDLSEIGTRVFVSCMAAATTLNVFLVIVSVTMYAQYCSCISFETRLAFTSQFGFLVPICAFTIIFVVILMMSSAMVVVYETTSETTFWVSLGVSIAICFAITYVSYLLPTWNQSKNYIGVMQARDPLETLAAASSDITGDVRQALADSNCEPEFLQFLFDLRHKDSKLFKYVEALTNQGVDDSDARKVVFQLRENLQQS